MFPGRSKWNMKVKGKQNLLFPGEPVMKYFVIPPNYKVESKTAESLLLNANRHKFVAGSRSKT